MKKLLYLLIALPMIALWACDDDDDKLPQFSVEVGMSGQTEINSEGIVIVPQGNVFKVDSLIPVRDDGKGITFGPVAYYWSGLYVGTSPMSPYPMTFNTKNLELGTYTLQMVMPVYAVDYSIAEGVLNYRVQIVEPVSDPDEGGSTVVSATPTVNSK